MRPKARPGLLPLALLLAACTSGSAEEAAQDKDDVGLFTSLPIYWGEGGIAQIIDGGGERDWVRTLIEQRFDIEPLDTVEADALAKVDRAILAQPRPLAPSENVALDEWVREGGRLLVFADPLLTRHTDYALGDKRRPQDVVLLSPILNRWGLELKFDESQPGGERWVEAYGGNFPVNLAGEFAMREGFDCFVSETGVLAQCNVGKGRVTLLADAAILDADHDGEVDGKRSASLDSLIAASLDF